MALTTDLRAAPDGDPTPPRDDPAVTWSAARDLMVKMAQRAGHLREALITAEKEYRDAQVRERNAWAALADARDREAGE